MNYSHLFFFICLRPLFASTVSEENIPLLAKTLFDMVNALEKGHRYLYAITLLNTRITNDRLPPVQDAYVFGENVFESLCTVLTATIHSIPDVQAQPLSTHNSPLLSSTPVPFSPQSPLSGRSQVGSTHFSLDASDSHRDVKSLSKESIVSIAQLVVSICVLDMNGTISMRVGNEKSLRSVREKLFELLVKHIHTFANGNSCQTSFQSLTVEGLYDLIDT